MTSGLLPRAVSGLVLLVTPLCSGCSSADAPAGAPAAATSTAPAGPTSAAGLEDLLLDAVPSGLPLVPDDELDPPAGEKTIDDVARYGDDAAEQRAVLQDYGYLRGWERFWRGGDRQTTVFLDQFSDTGGAAAYAEDLARNDAEYYGGELDSAPAELPDGCVTMARDEPAPEHGFAGPAAFAWCADGDLTVSVAVVTGGSDDALAELTEVTTEQLARLPG